MKKFISFAKNFIREEEGATVVEYAIMVALIIAACFVVITVLGTRINEAFQSFCTKFNNNAAC